MQKHRVECKRNTVFAIFSAALITILYWQNLLSGFAFLSCGYKAEPESSTRLEADNGFGWSACFF